MNRADGKRWMIRDWSSAIYPISQWTDLPFANPGNDLPLRIRMYSLFIKGFNADQAQVQRIVTDPYRI